MIGIVIATHANCGEGMLNGAELILGKQEYVKTVGLNHGDGIEALMDRIKLALKAVDNGDGVIGFVDFFGGSPSNIMSQVLRENSFPCVTGVNMPMFIEALSSRRNSKDVNELIKTCIDVGLSGICRLDELVENMSQSIDEEDF
jgi:PTS system mannose-specific IIA component